MQITINTQDGFYRSTDIHCGVVEFLTIKEALRKLARNPRVNKHDRELAQMLLHTQPTMREEGEQE